MTGQLKPNDHKMSPKNVQVVIITGHRMKRISQERTETIVQLQP